MMYGPVAKVSQGLCRLPAGRRESHGFLKSLKVSAERRERRSSLQRGCLFQVSCASLSGRPECGVTATRETASALSTECHVPIANVSPRIKRQRCTCCMLLLTG
ncbi:uncharacterized protein PV09_07829 [Verruconis gallopava]|uniref:Uncharacterized protein n=1 Tax=Verruconis gallopava TaxID=253628 RepID=A0A0D2A2P1_9PEZI|nr:uncharacterized protein PV09_07829 [Verruconis gallopava]KIW00635.1 hypothetical protein PV09_07829 [Verruconis gallopava]